MKLAKFGEIHFECLRRRALAKNQASIVPNTRLSSLALKNLVLNDAEDLARELNVVAPANARSDRRSFAVRYRESYRHLGKDLA